MEEEEKVEMEKGKRRWIKRRRRWWKRKRRRRWRTRMRSWKEENERPRERASETGKGRWSAGIGSRKRVIAESVEG